MTKGTARRMAQSSACTQAKASWVSHLRTFETTDRRFTLAPHEWERRVYSIGLTILGTLTVLRVIVLELRDLWR